MGFRFTLAQAASSLLSFGLIHIAHRPGGNVPGKVALKIDPQAISHARDKLSCGSVVVVGTNGKTTVTNLIADALEASGETVICNRTGANLSSGVASALLQGKPARWGVFESDELWLARTLPQLQATYVVLLNLFRDQLDRCGEIDRIQDSIVEALAASPNTVVLYNADDPLCAAIACRIDNKSFAFGLDEDLHLPQNTVADAQMCQRCSHMFTYTYRQYGQLGDYRCQNCGFKRPDLDFAAFNISMEETSLTFCIRKKADAQAFSQQSGACEAAADGSTRTIKAAISGAYMVYNLCAVFSAADLIGCSQEVIQRAIGTFQPNNGRLESLNIGGHATLLNLAKNPTGFNQNLKLVTQGTQPRVVAFFINDNVADGHDISWLWDIDFEELAAREDVIVFAGGIRGRDMQVRLKYAGIAADVVESTEELLSFVKSLPAEYRLYVIANYTALPQVKASLEAAAADADAVFEKPLREIPALPSISASDEPPVVIAHLFCDLLNLYGDGGNVRVLEQRLAWRGIPVRVDQVHHGQSVDLSMVDLVFLGGGPDREQKLASQDLIAMKRDLQNYIEDDGVLLAICGGYQILGREWLLGDEPVPGLGIVGLTTRRPGTSANRLIDNIVLDSPVVTRPVVGYENHAGRTYLDAGTEPFGTTISKQGCGNNEESRSDGVRYKNVIGTYLHGPLLGKNPEVADWLLARALKRRADRSGINATDLSPLDDSVEIAANDYMVKRLKV